MQLHADKGITLNYRDTCLCAIGGVEACALDISRGQPLEVREIRDDSRYLVLGLVDRVVGWA
jgi:hypothetical protein